MGSIRNGSGDDVFVLFNEHGCFVKGYSHEFPTPSFPSKSFYDSVPAVLQEAAIEPAFSPNNVSYCFWRLHGWEEWQSAVDESELDPNAFFLLYDLTYLPVSYTRFAQEYFEKEVDPTIVADILKGVPISASMATALNSEIDFNSLKTDVQEIGLPYLE